MQNCLTLLVFLAATSVNAALVNVTWTGSITNGTDYELSFSLGGTRYDGTEPYQSDVCQTATITVQPHTVYQISVPSPAGHTELASHDIVGFYMTHYNRVIFDHSAIFTEGQTVNLAAWHWTGSELIPYVPPVPPKAKGVVPVYGRVLNPDGSYSRKIVTFKKIK